MPSLVNMSGSPPTPAPPLPDIVLRMDGVTKTINRTVPLFVVVAGCISNLLVIVGVRSKSFRNIRTSYYMLCLAVSDVSAVLCLLIPHWLHATFPAAMPRGDSARLLCKFLQFYGWAQMDLAILLMALMSYDRAKALEKPPAQNSSLFQTRVTIFLAVVTCSAKDFHFWLAGEFSPRPGRMCSVRYISPAYATFWNSVWPWLHFAFHTGCFLWMGVCNGYVVRVFRQARRTSRWNHQELSSQVTRMLLAESITFTLLTLPLCVHTFVSSRLESAGQIDTVNGTTPLAVSLSGLLFTVAFNTLYLNKCVTFAVYCIFSKTFRQTVSQQTAAFLQALLTCRFPPSVSGKPHGEVQESCEDVTRHSTNGESESTPDCSDDDGSDDDCSDDEESVCSCTHADARTAVTPLDFTDVNDPAREDITTVDDTDLEKNTLDDTHLEKNTLDDTHLEKNTLDDTGCKGHNPE